MWRGIARGLGVARGPAVAHRLQTPRIFLAWHLAALLLAPLPSPPLTRDQVWLMQRDNLADPDAGGFADLAIVPRTLHDSLPRCLPTR